MSITTYAELSTAVANWLHRADLTSQIPDFITLCEAKINRNLRISTMETRVTATLDEQYETVPTDFLEMRSIQTTGVSGRPLEYVSPHSFNTLYKTSDTGSPMVYTIIDGTIAFGPAPDGSYTMEMVYYKAIPVLSGSQTTNWMLTNHPDVYLYGSLKEAAGFVKDDPRLGSWKAQYEEALQQVKDADSRARWVGPMTIRAHQ